MKFKTRRPIKEILGNIRICTEIETTTSEINAIYDKLRGFGYTIGKSAIRSSFRMFEGIYDITSYTVDTSTGEIVREDWIEMSVKEFLAIEG